MLHAVLVFLYFCFFFFKQKTAYEMRISDWSSDVCSSDLHASRGSAQGGIRLCRGPRRARRLPAHPHPAAGRLLSAPATRTAIPSTLVSPRQADRRARIRGLARIPERSVRISPSPPPTAPPPPLPVRLPGHGVVGIQTRDRRGKREDRTVR